VATRTRLAMVKVNRWPRKMLVHPSRRLPSVMTTKMDRRKSVPRRMEKVMVMQARKAPLLQTTAMQMSRLTAMMRW